jgi:hypothetical protein
MIPDQDEWEIVMDPITHVRTVVPKNDYPRHTSPMGELPWAIRAAFADKFDDPQRSRAQIGKMQT